jgi:hypothetical protein
VDVFQLRDRVVGEYAE